MSPIEHAPTETNGSIAAPDTNGRYVVYTSTQALFFSLDTCAKILDVPSNTFHFIGGTVGRGFGGKGDTLTEALALLGALPTARLRRHRDGLCARMPDGQARPSRRHRPDGVSYPQRLSRRRHEGASARSQKHGADRMRPGRGRKGQVAASRRGQADVVAQGWRRQ